MAVNRRKSVPPVSPKIATELRPLVTAIKEIIEVGEGVRGDPLDRKLTLRDLLDSGIGKLKRGQSAANPGSLEPGTGVPDLSTPPTPQGFEAVGAFDGEIFLTWKPPTKQYNNHAFTNIYRAEADNFANATLVGQEPGMFFVDNVRADAAPKLYYYWISFTSTSDIEGPLNDTAGTQAQAVSSPDYIIDKIQGLISESELANELLTPIQSIPSIQTTLSDHGIRIPDLENTVTQHALDILDNTDAYTALETRVSTNEGDVSAQASEITAIQATLNDLTVPTFDASNNYAVGELFRYDNVVYEVVATQSQPNATPPNASYYDPRPDYESIADTVSANASAVSALDTRVTAAEGTITAQGTDITQLQSDLSTTDGNVSSNATAIGQLQTEVSNIDGVVTSQSTDITQLQNDLDAAELDITANANAYTALESRVSTNEGDIASQSTQITNLGNSLSTAEGDISANSQTLNLLDSRVQTAEGTISAHTSDISQLQTDLNNLDVDGNAAALQALDTRVTANEDEITAISSDVTTLTASVGDNTTALQTKAEVSAVQDLESNVTTLAAQYTIKLDVNDRVSGIGFSNDDTGSAMVVASDAVYFIDPGQSVTPFDPNINYASMTAARDTQLVFGYAEVEGQRRFVINAPAYIPELYVETGMFKDQVVTRAKIANLAVNGAKIDVADVWELNINDRIESDNYSPGVSGFRVNRNGSAELNDVIVRGHVSMATGYISDAVQIGGNYSYWQEIETLFELREDIEGFEIYVTGADPVEFPEIPDGWYDPVELGLDPEDFILQLSNVPNAEDDPYFPRIRATFSVGALTSGSRLFVKLSGDYDPVAVLEISVNGGSYQAVSAQHVTVEPDGGAFGTDNYTLETPVSLTANASNEVALRVKSEASVGPAGYIFGESMRITRGMQVGTSGDPGTPLSEVKDNAALADSWKRPGYTLIDGNKIFTGDAYVDTLQIKGNAVVVNTLYEETGLSGTRITSSMQYDHGLPDTIPCIIIATSHTPEADNVLNYGTHGIKIDPSFPVSAPLGFTGMANHCVAAVVANIPPGSHTISAKLSTGIGSAVNGATMTISVFGGKR